MQDSSLACVERTIGKEIILDAPNGTPWGVRHLESRFGPFGDSVSVGAILVHGLRQTYQRLKNHFGRTRRYS
jgi:hypothetical protein